MKIEIIKACYVEGKAKKVGDVVDTKHSSLLIGVGKAVAHVDKPKPAQAEIKKHTK